MGGNGTIVVASALTLLLTGAAPSLAADAPAEPPPAATAKQEARALYIVGLEAQQQRDWQGAYTAFAKAWKLNRHYQIAGNLGSVEIELERYGDAAEHLEYALREIRTADTADPGEVRALEQLLTDARRRLARIRLRTHWVGAELSQVQLWVDGARQPLRPTLYLSAGAHTLQVRTAGGQSPMHQVTAAPGSTQDVALSVHLVPTPATAPIGVPGETSTPGSDAPGRVNDERPLWPAVVGGAVALAAATLGIGALVVASGRNDDADDLGDEVTASTALDAPVACSAAAGSALTTCDAWRSTHAESHTWAAVAAAGFVVAGGATVGSLLYLLWPSSDRSAAGPALEARIGLGELGLGGTF